MKIVTLALVAVVFCGCLHQPTPKPITFFSPDVRLDGARQIAIARAVRDEWLRRRFDQSFRTYMDDTLLAGTQGRRFFGKSEIRGDFTGIVFTIFSIENKKGEVVVGVETVSRLKENGNNFFIDEYHLTQASDGTWNVTQVINCGAS
jgi:hypothetical protein